MGKSVQVEFVLVPGFSLLSLSCAVDALRAANLVLGRTVYAWRLSADFDHLASGDGVPSSSDIRLSAVPLAARTSSDTPPDLLAVVGGERSHHYDSEALAVSLKRAAARGARVGSISDGAFPVAANGLFDGYRSTIHWKCLDAYRERFPDLDIRTSIYEIDRDRFSCAGGTTSLDLMLTFVMEAHGARTASLVAENYAHDRIREAAQEQHVTAAIRMAGRNQHVAEAALLMEQHLEDPLSVDRIARAAGISPRQLTRLFRSQLGRSPGQFYLDLRVDRAASLLRQTSMSISEIAVGCGFQSASHLGRFLKRRHGATPGQWRRGP
ncbi:MAG: GlxA family transcriptional regulator [Rhodospirillales bacterium]|nr:GlxA family transcriptional regulator [Rhodospirillales bacterium]